jgi:FRG domain
VSPEEIQEPAAVEIPAAAEAAGELETAVVGNVAEFVAALSTRPEDETVWYRGHARLSHQLVPSLARPPRKVEAEETLLKRFKQNAYPFLKTIPDGEWEWLFLMQHHAVPTRLLDWSDSPLVALWFAMQATVDPADDEDACVWALRPLELNLNANVKPDFEPDIPLFGQDQVLDNYLPSKVFSERFATLKPAAGIAPRQFGRVVAQMGSFTITHKEQYPLEKVAPRCLTRYVVPVDKKEDMRRDLRYLRMTRLAVFPELVNVAEVAQENLWS